MTSGRPPVEDYDPYFGKHLKREDLFSFWATDHTDRSPHPALGAQSAQTDGSMPRCYFDTSDGDTFVKDEEGITLRGVEATRLQAQGAPADMARDVVPGDGPDRTMTVQVRDRAGKVVLRAALVLRVEIQS